ncbi:hypothetical protein ACFLQU_00780 [Verrucomicrobiota bacterium]
MDSDQLIRLARSVHAGDAASAGDLATAIAEDANTSGYGRALALSLRRLRDASAFLDGLSDTQPDVTQ